VARQIDFFFDFSSPYAYLASTRIDAVAAKHGRTVRWRPFLLGAVYKATGYHPLEQAAKRQYFLRDVPRAARLLGVPFAVPASFPENQLAASRATYWIEDQDAAKAGAFAKAAFAAYWAQGKKLPDPEIVAGLAAEQGFAREAVLSALNDPKVKDRLKSETDAALAAGIFGSPVTMVDGEPFWGSDRLDQIDRWLATGGW
jgi:2-hydroxychromene-2-carboxylate isomerase